MTWRGDSRSGGPRVLFHPAPYRDDSGIGMQTEYSKLPWVYTAGLLYRNRQRLPVGEASP